MMPDRRANLGGRSVSELERQIDAIMPSRGSAMDTRDVADFENYGVELVEPRQRKWRRRGGGHVAQ